MKKKIIDKYQNTPFAYVFNDLYTSIFNFCIKQKIKIINVSTCIDYKDDVYWDYCHPSNKVTEKIALEIYKRIKNE